MSEWVQVLLQQGQPAEGVIRATLERAAQQCERLASDYADAGRDEECDTCKQCAEEIRLIIQEVPR